MALIVEQHILRFQVPVDNPIFVQNFNCQYHLTRVELRPQLCEVVIAPQVVEELASIQEVHYKVESLGCLEGKVQLNNERGLHMLKDYSLHYIQTLNVSHYNKLTFGVLSLVLAEDHILF